MKDNIDLARDEDEVRHVVLDEGEVGAPGEMRNVVQAAGHQVVDHDDLVTLLEESVTHVGANEAGSAGHKDAHRSLRSKPRAPRTRASGRIIASSRSPASGRRR